MSAAPARNSKRWFWPVIIGGVAIVAILAIVLGSRGGDGGNSGGTGATGSKHIEVAKVVDVTGKALPEFQTSAGDAAIGERAPTLEGVDFSSAAVTVGGSSGKPQVISFVAHWCPHCQREVPIIVSLARQGVFDGVELAAVATGTRPDAPNYPPSEWLSREQWRGTILVDTAEGTAAKAYGLTGYPLLTFIAADGSVAGRWSGEMEPADLQANVEALKAGRPLPMTLVR